MKTRLSLLFLALLGVALGVLFAMTAPAYASGSDPGYAITDTAGVDLAGTTVTSPFAEVLQAPTGTTITKVKWYAKDGTVFVGQTDAPDALGRWTWTGYVNPGARTLKAKVTTSAGQKQAVTAVTAAVPAAPSTPPAPPTPAGPFTTVNVSTAGQLQTALTGAQPGDRIVLADGTYSGNFTLTADGTADQPILVEGGPDAEIVSPSGNDGGSYALHLTGVDQARLSGFTVHTAKKGIVLDGSTHVLLSGLDISDIGDEAVHLRGFSSDNWVIGNTISDTGHANDGFGEGVYIGSAQGNWPNYSGGLPDKSDRNTISYNSVTDTTAENVDIKEGTEGGWLDHNTFDGASLSGANSADSNIDVKGQGWLISDNTATGSIGNAFESHVPWLPGGAGNYYAGNTLYAATGFAGFWLDGTAANTGNIIRCTSNTVAPSTLLAATTNNAPVSCVT